MHDHEPSPFRDPTGAPAGAPVVGEPTHKFPAGPGGEPVTLVGPSAWKAAAAANMRSWRATAARVRHVEGPRGLALRWSVALRYLAYLGVIIGCTAIIGAAFAGTRWSYGAPIVLFSAAVMLGTAALGTMFLADRRPKILEELRKFLFQMLLFPSTSIALGHWFLRRYTSDPGAQNDFLGLLDTYLPVFFLLPALLSCIVFVRMISGLRYLDRSQADAEEALNTWSRQDFHHP